MPSTILCTVRMLREDSVYVETQRLDANGRPSKLRGAMWLTDEVPPHLRYDGCQFRVTFIALSNGTCSSYIEPLKSVEPRPDAEVVLTTMITLVCVQFLIELSVMGHRPEDGPWVALSWLLTLSIVCGWRFVAWLASRTQVKFQSAPPSTPLDLTQAPGQVRMASEPHGVDCA